MDMNYDILSYDELPADEAAMLKADAEEAERGYTDEQLSEALKRTPGRPLAVAAPLPPTGSASVWTTNATRSWNGTCANTT